MEPLIMYLTETDNLPIKPQELVRSLCNCGHDLGRLHHIASRLNNFIVNENRDRVLDRIFDRGLHNVPSKSQE